MVFSNNLLMGAGGQASGYEIDQSIRFNDDDSAFLARTPSASNRKTWTWSAWVKRADLFNGSVPQILLSAGDGGSNDFIMQFGQSDDTLRISDYISSTQSNLITTQLFRDVSAWYHFVLAYDTTQGTAANRIKLYVNGSQVTAFGTEIYPSENQDLVINSAIAHNIGRGAYSSNGYFSGYMAEINFVDGTALAPTAFGETNTNGVWVPIAYTGSYGTEGYFIDGRDSSDLGDDESGNGNDFSSSGLAAADQMSDSPTNNHCTLNPIQQDATGLSDGNLQFTTSSTSTHKTASGTIAATSGKYYCEVTCNATLGSNARIGIIPDDNEDYTGSNGHVGDDANSFAYVDNGQKESNNSQSSYGASYANGDVIAMALNLDDNEITFFKDGASQGAISITANTEYRFAASQFGSGGMAFNFGQAAFAATPPTGFKALNTANLSTPTISDPSEYVQADLYTAQTTGFSPTFDGNSDLAPDFLWFKRRNGASNNFLFDKVRGVNKGILSDATTAEATYTNSLTAFGTDGFTLGDGGSSNDINGVSGATYVAWGWAAGGTSGSTNDDGSVDSTVTVNTTAGFSICKYNPGGNSNVTFGHGLGVAPRLVLVKNLEDATNWQVLHLDQGVGNKLFLNTNATTASDANMWQNTAPTSSVVSVGTAQTSNEQCIAYVWNEVEGFSKFGSFSGNGNAAGPFVYTGFAPSVIILKNITQSYNWQIRDNKRNTFNVNEASLSPSLSDAEATSSDKIDFLSNGFKIRDSGATNNGSGNTILYMAWAEHPFGGDGIAPATAR